ncbi:MAG: 30S ribosomal protein S6 [Chloroflexia bacterium]|nr:30S ribosomal protein S6 [Chloroflexia bacterium]
MLREQERAPRKYELMTILHPEVAEESLPGELERISGFITGAGGEMIETLQDSPWGRRRLAYAIRSGSRDVRDGYYTVWHFTLGPDRVNDLERELKLDTQLIRYIVVSWEPVPIDPKAVEAAEIAAEDAAAAAYVAAQAADAAAEDDAAAAYAASQVEATAPVTADESTTETDVAAEETRAGELTAEAEALEATGAELAIEPVAAVEEREELEADAAAALETMAAAIVAEPAAAEAATEAAAAEAATEAAEDDDVPEGAVRGDGTGDCPEDYPIKGNATSKLFHSPGSPSYKRTVPEFCFASTAAAEAAGFNPTKYEAAHEEGN